MDYDIDKNSGGVIKKGEAAVKHSRYITESHMRFMMIRFVLLSVVSVVFILSSCFLIVFAPSDRNSIVLPVSIGLGVIGIGLGGFTAFRLRIPGASLSAEAGGGPKQN